ncbi:MAG: SDR family NAD(P)-dependent oxidoreductase [Acidimicrobiales bacterium]
MSEPSRDARADGKPDGHTDRLPDAGVELAGKVAVVTGAASGMGEAMAERAATEGMHVVLVDVEEQALARVAERLAGTGATVWPMQADVSDRAAVVRVADRVGDEVGPTWLLVNNAGVGSSAPVHALAHEQWEFVLGVNLWGVVHGLETFLPGMIERDAGYVVNTASMAGLMTCANLGAYVASKHAVVGLSEVLYRELEEMGSKVGVSVLCPGGVVTNIMRAERNWPARLGPAPSTLPGEYPDFPERKEPSEVADQVFEAIAARRFWVLTHPWQYADAIRARAEGVIAGRNPDDTTLDPIVKAMRDRGSQPRG